VKKLTSRQQRFVEAYAVTLNAASAARTAGYAARRSDVAGSRLLANPVIRRVLAARKARQAERADVRGERVLRELKNISFASATDFFDAQGNVLPPTAWTPEMAAAVAGFEVTRRHAEDGKIDTVQKIKFWDKPKSLELLARHLNLLVEKVEHTGTLTIEWLPAPAEASATVAAEAVTPVRDTRALPPTRAEVEDDRS
jgi:phage terminase small subunit